MGASTGHSSSIAFGTSSISANVVSIDPPEESVEDIALPHLGLTALDNIPYEPGDLREGGEITCVFENDRDTSILTGVSETITWTKPLNSGDSTAANWAFTGYIKSVKEGTYQTGERLLTTVVAKVAGNVTKTAAS